MNKLVDGLVAVHLDGILEMEMAEELFDFDDGLRGLGLFLESDEFVDGFIEMKVLVHVEIPFGLIDFPVYGDVTALKLLIHFQIK